ncbi:MAG: hypothetical protein L0Y77_10615 [Chlorobi bacterium]|nr:hypothetical protein [Chlorobiota bacterium]
MKLLLLTITVLFIGCNEKQAEVTFEDKMKDKCESYLRTNLKDPESFKNYGWKITQTNYEVYKNETENLNFDLFPFYPYIYELDYGGRNSFGGMVRNTAYFIVDTTGQFEYVGERLPKYITPK